VELSGSLAASLTLGKLQREDHRTGEGEENWFYNSTASDKHITQPDEMFGARALTLS
jgi:hypothetical protein